MNQRDIIQGDTILVPIKLDETGRSLVAWACELAQILDKKIRLLHVLQPWLDIPLNFAFGESSTLLQLERAQRLRQKQQALAKMKELQRHIPSIIPSDLKLREGSPVECILAESTDEATSFILLNLGKADQRIWLEGISTPFSVAVLTRVPIMIVQCGQPSDFTNRELKLLFADDLRSHSDNALRHSFVFMQAMPQAVLHHIHVCNIDEQQIHSALDSPQAVDYTALAQTVCVDDLLRDTCLRLDDKLRQRLDENIPYHQSSGQKWVQKVLVGETVSQIEHYINYIAPDMLIFGRHHALNQKPYSVGRLAFRLMLENRQPVFIVPED